MRSSQSRLHVGLIAASTLLALVAIFSADGFPRISRGLLMAIAAVPHVVVLLSMKDELGRDTRDQEHLSLRLLFVGVALWGLALGARGFESVRGVAQADVMVPSLGDFLALAGDLAVLASVLWLPLMETRRFGRVRTLLEYSILLGSAISLSAVILLEPPIMLQMADFSIVVWLGIGPLIGVALIAVLARLWLSETLRSSAFQAVGVMIWLLLRLTGDLGYGFIHLQDQYAGSLVSPSAWFLSGIALWGAILAGPFPVARRAVEKQPELNLREQLGRRLPALLSYMLVGYVIIDRWISGEFDPYAVASIAVLLLLALARQGVIAGQLELRQYASLVNSAAELAFVTDQEGRFLLTNPAFQRATGASAERPGEASLGDVLADRNRSVDLLAHSAEGGWSGEIEFRSPLGGSFPAHLALAPIRDEAQGRPLLAGTGHDLTETKQREQELRDALEAVDQTRAELADLNIGLEKKVAERTVELERLVSDLETLNEELKELDQLKSEFVTLVSHELRSPLTNIRNGIELAIRHKRAAAGDSGVETLDLVLQETERLTSFVETILDLSALEAGRFPLTLKTLDPSLLLATVRDRFPSDVASRIEVKCEEPIPYLVADESGLASVLFHLLDNAAKYAPDGSILVHVHERNDGVVLSVADEGPGIPEGSREAVFDRFHRLDHSDSREVYGHGLGLYLCRRLTHAMGGTITISASHSPGARFDLCLPPPIDASGPGPQAVSHGEDLGGREIQ